MGRRGPALEECPPAGLDGPERIYGRLALTRKRTGHGSAHASGLVAVLDALFRDRSLLSDARLDEMLAFSETDADPEWAASAGLAQMDGYGLGLIRWRPVLLANGSSFVAGDGNLSARVDLARDVLTLRALTP